MRPCASAVKNVQTRFIASLYELQPHQTKTMEQGEIVIYKTTDTNNFQLEVRVEDETVWLTQNQMVELFNSTKQNISLHINNIFKEGELDANSTVKEYLTVQQEGKRKVKRKIALYNLDVIISVGYRVKSQRGTQFRIWANKVLKDYLLKGYAINHRVDKIEKKLIEHDQKFELFINTNLPPSLVRICNPYPDSHHRCIAWFVGYN